MFCIARKTANLSCFICCFCVTYSFFPEIAEYLQLNWRLQLVYKNLFLKTSITLYWSLTVKRLAVVLCFSTHTIIITIIRVPSSK